MANRPLDPRNLPSNNREAPREEVSRIRLSGDIKKKKKKGLAFDIAGIMNSLYDSVIIPAVKNIIEDFGTNAISMALYRDDNREPRGRGGRGRGGYSNSYDLRNSRTTRPSARNVSPSAALELDQICFTKHRDAEDVLARMIEYIADYETVSVADFYDLVGATSSYLHKRYVWTSLKGVRILRDPQGFYIDFPEPYYEP